MCDGRLWNWHVYLHPEIALGVCVKLQVFVCLTCSENVLEDVLIWS